MKAIAANIEAIQGRITAAAQRAGREPGAITLVAVTKTHPVETVLAAYRLGLRHFGENRATEGADKITAMQAWLESASSQSGPVWHMIGHVQSRQVGEVLGRFDLVHSIDSLKLAKRFDRLARRDELPPVEILLQCNVSGEGSKFGFELYHWSANQTRLKAFIEAVDQIAQLERVKIRGLMTMAPICENPEEVRPVFRSLADLQARLRQERPQLDWHHLSMGMTDDFEVAIEEGATLVRVGRAIFGERL